MSASTSARMLRNSIASSIRLPASSTLAARTMATRSTAHSTSSSPSSAASPSSYWTGMSAAFAIVAGVSAAAYSLNATRSPIMLEPRASFSDRMKAKKSSGDVELNQDAKQHKQPELETAEETPDAIEVAAEEVTEQGEQQSAYDPETGEINWDCPCLGGMTHGPCGEQFKAAFSCFVYSEEEPKGIDCVDKFKLMQDCFREYPEIYKDEVEDDEAAGQDESSSSSSASSGDDGSSNNKADEESKPAKEKNAALGGDKKQGGPAGSGAASVDFDNRGGPNPDKVDKDDDPERRKREHDVFTNRASSGPTPRG